MSTSTERVFIIGGTGNVGSKTVNDLLAKNIPVTLYARQPEKVNKLFANNSLVQVVQGDYDDLAPLKEGLKGHTSWAYEAGVKQVVDISSMWASMPWRSTSIGTSHYYAEKAIYEIPNRGAFVTLRPGRFMSNLFFFDGPRGDHIVDTMEEDKIQGWISPNDIGAVAAVVLSEPIEKHADLVYELSGDIVTPAQRTQYFSRTIGREFTYKKISPKEKYDVIMSIGHFNHAFAYTLAASLSSFDIQHHHISNGITILLGREPETLEKFILDNKAAFK
ncbi:unnamed protein product [Rhizopus stolonifer]